MSNFRIDSTQGALWRMWSGAPFARGFGHSCYRVKDPMGAYTGEGETRVYIEADGMGAADIEYQKWYNRLEGLYRQRKLPSTIIMPERIFVGNGNRAGYIVKLPGSFADIDFLADGRSWSDNQLLLELYLRSLRDAESVGLTPAAFLINLRRYSVYVDTMPSRMPRPWADRNYFFRVYGSRVDPKNVWRQVNSTTSLFKDVSGLSDARYQAVAGREGVKPGRVRVMAVVSAPRRLLTAGGASRKAVDWTPGDAVTLRDLDAALPVERLLEVRRNGQGQITLYNASGYEWVSSRYFGMRIARGAELTPRVNETIVIELRDRTRVELQVKGFQEGGRSASVTGTDRSASASVSRPANEPGSKPPEAGRAVQSTSGQPEAGRAAQSTSGQSEAGRAVQSTSGQSETIAAPVQSAVSQSVSKPLSALYEYDAPDLPASGHSIPARELSTGRRVLLEHYSGVPAALRNVLEEQRSHPPAPVGGLCAMVNIHACEPQGDFILARAYPPAEGWYAAGSPALRGFSEKSLFAAAEAMMRLLDGVLKQGWLPVRFVEAHMLIRPQTGEARFLDGAWLAGENQAPLECTLGYRAPQAYDEGHLAAVSDAGFCAAVWLYRLLIGGYPMEGAKTRGALLEAERTAEAGEGGIPVREEDFAPSLYGREALFVFDPVNGGNAIEKLGGAYEDQIRRWNSMPEALRRGWTRTFSECLHRDTERRVSPAEWAEILKKSGSADA